MTNKFIEQRVEALENELSELKLIVAQIRKPSTVVQESLTAATSVEDIIEFEGAQYKKVNREAREGDVVIFRVNETDEFHSVVNKPYLVVSDDDVPRFTGESGTNYRVYTDDHNRTPETVDVYELIVEDKPFDWVDELLDEDKSPNQLRAEMIEKAKRFVEKHLTNSVYGHGVVANNMTPTTINAGPVRVEFVVNEKKRTIVALTYFYHTKGITDYKGIAKCMPDDVYNEHIGKAIALGRALGLDVSEFEQVVQPTEFAKGQIIRTAHMALDDHEIIRIKGNYAYFMDGSREEFHYLHRAQEDRFEIINDTNAIYGGVE